MHKKILIIGILGKMGTMLTHEMSRLHPDWQVDGVDTQLQNINKNMSKYTPTKQSDTKTSLTMGNVGNTKIYKTVWSASKNYDIIVDFSTTSGKKDIIDFALTGKAPLAVFSTSYSEQDIILLKNASKNIPILLNQNASIGINAIFDILPSLTKKLNNADIIIDEIHHKTKKDSPSGTAKKLEQIISRQTNNVKTFSQRAGTECGYHKIQFFLEDEVITLSHRAYSRKIFVIGAIKMIEKLMQQKSGLYEKL